MQTNEVDLLKQEVVERDDFLAFIAHELRNPLHAIGLLVASARVSAEAAGVLLVAERIRRAENAISLYNLRASELLELAQSVSDTFRARTQSVDLDALLKSTVEKFQGEAALKSTCLNYAALADPCAVETDPRAIEHIVTNLVVNAIRHSRSSSITVNLGFVREGTAEIVVADNGCGIPVEQQESIFQKFERGAGPAATKSMGSGLGLWIVKKMVQAVHGTISLESSLNSGSRFVFRFPLLNSPTP